MTVRQLTRLIIAFLLCLASSVPIDAQVQLSDLVARTKPAVVRVVAQDKQGKVVASGSGFYVSSDKVITNKHVVSESESLSIETSNGLKVRIASRIDDPYSDLSLLTTEVSNSKVQPLQFSRVLPKEGDRVFIVGSPLGLEGSTSDGIISAYRTIDGIGSAIQLTAPISSGSSGSPVLDLRGEVVGVATAYLSGGQNLNFAVSSERIIAIWKDKIILSDSRSETPVLGLEPELKTRGSLRTDGIYATEFGGYSQYIRFYKDGVITSINLTGRRDDRAGSNWLEDKTLSHLARGRYVDNGSEVSFVTSHKKMATLSYRCVLSGLQLNCNVHDKAKEIDFVKYFNFVSFSQIR